MDFRKVGFNVGTEDHYYMKLFCENYYLKSLIRQPTCYKNPDNPTCIDLILTNVPRSFQSTCVLETGLSDYHFMALTVMRKRFKKFQPRIISTGLTNIFPMNILENVC